MDKNDTIQSFTDLIAWQEVHQLVLSIYQYQATKSFPAEEKYSLTDQMRQSASWWQEMLSIEKIKNLVKLQIKTVYVRKLL